MHKIIRLHHGLSRDDMRMNDRGGTLLSLAMRLFVGWQFFKAGLTKIADWSGPLVLFCGEYQVRVTPPELAAVTGATGG